MPEGMPDRMPDKMSDRMPEDLPVTKCINVMVGITRSKVIFISAFARRCRTLRPGGKSVVDGTDDLQAQHERELCGHA